jgi:hypothetical protein
MSNLATIFLGNLSLKSHIEKSTVGQHSRTIVHVNSAENLTHDIFVRQNSPVTIKSKASLFDVSRTHISRSRYGFISLLALSLTIFLTGLLSGYNDWQSNRLSAARASQLIASANATNTLLPKTQTTTAPSTIKPSLSAVATYTVAPSLPRYLIIPKLGVDARILSVGVSKSGAIETPENVYDTAWYKQSAQPGQPGAMLIDGHVSSWTTRGVFYGLKTLVAGDKIEIQRGDGTVFMYKVVRTQVYNTANVDMTAALAPVVAGHPGLNLITCTGDVISGTNEFNERVLIFAEQI